MKAIYRILYFVMTIHLIFLAISRMFVSEHYILIILNTFIDATVFCPLCSNLKGIQDKELITAVLMRNLRGSQPLLAPVFRGADKTQ